MWKEMISNVKINKLGCSMKTLFRVILFGLVIFGNAEVWGTDWKIFGYNDSGSRYYDAESITSPSRNIIRVWEQFTFSEKYIIDLVRQHGKRYENSELSKTLWEFDCVEKRFRGLSSVFYSKEGSNVIHSVSSPSEWHFIPPESMMNTLLKIVCKQMKGDG